MKKEQILTNSRDDLWVYSLNLDTLEMERFDMNEFYYTQFKQTFEYECQDKLYQDTGYMFSKNNIQFIYPKNKSLNDVHVIISSLMIRWLHLYRVDDSYTCDFSQKYSHFINNKDNIEIKMI